MSMKLKMMGAGFNVEKDRKQEIYANIFILVSADYAQHQDIELLADQILKEVTQVPNELQFAVKCFDEILQKDFNAPFRARATLELALTEAVKKRLQKHS